MSQDPEGRGYGASAYDAAKAERRLRQEARIWRSKNPNASIDEFLRDMEATSDKLVGLNPDAAADSKSMKMEGWREVPLFKTTEDLRSAVDEFNRSQGRVGIIATISTATRADPQELIKEQQRLLKQAAPPRQ